GQEQEGDGNREPLTLLPVMRTNFEPYDKGRELILEAARAVMDSMTEFETEGSKSFNQVLVAMRHLIASVKKQFAWEEHDGSADEKHVTFLSKISVVLSTFNLSAKILLVIESLISNSSFDVIPK
ncbi:MAG: hypothetical protein EZS28_054939, partial [Streblomastix strix]